MTPSPISNARSSEGHLSNHLFFQTSSIFRLQNIFSKVIAAFTSSFVFKNQNNNKSSHLKVDQILIDLELTTLRSLGPTPSAPIREQTSSLEPIQNSLNHSQPNTLLNAPLIGATHQLPPENEWPPNLDLGESEANNASNVIPAPMHTAPPHIQFNNTRNCAS